MPTPELANALDNPTCQLGAVPQQATQMSYIVASKPTKLNQQLRNESRHVNYVKQVNQDINQVNQLRKGPVKQKVSQEKGSVHFADLTMSMDYRKGLPKLTTRMDYLYGLHKLREIG